MSEQLLIQHCAPTLAGIKTGNIFSCRYTALDEVTAQLDSLNMRLSSKGVRLLLLRYSNTRVLIYVYRPDRLSMDLRASGTRDILRRCGYDYACTEQCVVHLIDRLRQFDEFPHEIGCFLGYPPEDVQGFIENRSDCKYTGTWKVYGDVGKAKRMFAQYKKCTDLYRRQWEKGISLDRLAVRKINFWI